MPRDEIRYIDRYVKAGAKLDYWWIDAGWYPCGDGWGNVGTWEPDPQRYPKGLREVADRVHAGGMKLVVWFEPERVTAGSWLAEHHPEWVLGGKKGGLLNLGNPEARTWLTEHVDKMIRSRASTCTARISTWSRLASGGTTTRRTGRASRRSATWKASWPTGTNSAAGIPTCRLIPAPAAVAATTWRRSAAPSRCCGAITVSCRPAPRATPMEWRFGFPTTARAWGPSVITSSAATGAPWLGIGPNEIPGKGPDWANYQRMIAELRRVAPYFSGDYYPLSGYNLDETAWMAWQFDRPDLGEGVVQAFRRSGSYYESARFPLGGLEADARYVITDMDSGRSQVQTGRELTDKGLTVSLDKPASACVLLYKKAGSRDKP